MKIAVSVASLYCGPEFLYPTLYPQTGSVQSITAEDVNGDSRRDLVLNIYADTHPLRRSTS